MNLGASCPSARRDAFRTGRAALAGSATTSSSETVAEKQRTHRKAQGRGHLSRKSGYPSREPRRKLLLNPIRAHLASNHESAAVQVPPATQAQLSSALALAGATSVAAENRITCRNRGHELHPQGFLQNANLVDLVAVIVVDSLPLVRRLFRSKEGWPAQLSKTTPSLTLRDSALTVKVAAMHRLSAL